MAPVWLLLDGAAPPPPPLEGSGVGALVEEAVESVGPDGTEGVGVSSETVEEEPGTDVVRVSAGEEEKEDVVVAGAGGSKLVDAVYR